MERLVADGRIRRLRRGLYTNGARRRGGPEARDADLLLRSRATAHVLEPGTVLSHVSALAVHGLPIVGIPTSRVTTTRARLIGGGSCSPLVRGHAGPLDGAVTCVDGLAVTTVARTVVDVAREPGGHLAGTCAADAALARGSCTQSELRHEVEIARGRTGVGRARAVVEAADGRAESPLESISRAHMAVAGMPAPQLQVWIPLRDGSRRRVDFYWDLWRVVGEADGFGKYGIDGGDADAVRRDLRREKARQNELELAGYRSARWTWQDAMDVWPMVRAIREQMHIQAAAGFGPAAA